MPAIRLYITGLVQGVFFRAGAEKKAAELGVNGWIKNTADGGVEAQAEGPRKAINDFADWCKKGPEGSRVDGVNFNDVSEEGCSGFQVRRD